MIGAFTAFGERPRLNDSPANDGQNSTAAATRLLVLVTSPRFPWGGRHASPRGCLCKSEGIEEVVRLVKLFGFGGQFRFVRRQSLFR